MGLIFLGGCILIGIPDAHDLHSLFMGRGCQAWKQALSQDKLKLKIANGKEY